MTVKVRGIISSLSGTDKVKINFVILFLVQYRAKLSSRLNEILIVPALYASRVNGEIGPLDSLIISPLSVANV